MRGLKVCPAQGRDRTKCSVLLLWLTILMQLPALPVMYGGSTVSAGDRMDWPKHVVAAPGHCNTAVAIDVNGDQQMDVVACSPGQVVLYIAPAFDEKVVLHQFERARQNCIHSTVLDVDGDGDMDWVGTVAADHPFWLENPGSALAFAGPWRARAVDHDITGIHCLTTADVNNDGRDDVVINNFEPEKGLRDSIAWFEVPVDPHRADHWIRHVFAAGDARGGSHYMGVGDIDGDGWKEIAVGAKGGPFADGNWFAYWQNPGRQTINGPWKKVLLASEQTAATNILPADINGDGLVDWVASRGHGQGAIWFQNPAWKIHTIDAQIRYPHSLTVADHDQDGDVDVATCGFGSERVMWYENNGKGRFELHMLDDAQQSYDLRSVDMDGDGDLDLLNAGRGTHNVAWYENRLK